MQPLRFKLTVTFLKKRLRSLFLESINQRDPQCFAQSFCLSSSYPTSSISSNQIPSLTQVFIFSVSCFLVSMSGNTVNLMSDYEGETFLASRMRISPYSRIPPLDHNPLEPEVMHLSDDSDSKRVFGDSLEEITS